MKCNPWVGGSIGRRGFPMLGTGKRGLTTLVKDIFRNGEQGFFYDPNDLSTMYQAAGGAIPVTAAGQPVGLILDKSKGLLLGNELAPPVTSMNGWITLGQPANGTVTADTSGINFNANAAGILALLLPNLSADKLYKVSVSITQVSGIFVAEAAPGGTGFSITKPGTYTYFSRGRVNVYFRNNPNVACTAKISAITVKELSGNHAYQTTSAASPILRDTPHRIDFDAVDNKLITNLPGQLTGCTVVRSVPNVGTQILTGQTIPATCEDNKDHCGLIVINRALTATETAQITRLFNKAAGV